MKSKSKILIVIFVLILGGILYTTSLLNQKKVETIQIASNNLINADEETIQTIGQEAKVSGLSIIERRTGTGPFDENDEAGNDSAETNEIVRSFDKVTWKVEATMALKENSTESSYKGGVLDIEVTLPENCKNLVNWDLDAMKWAENGEVTENGTKFTAKYSMSNAKITIPGKQELVCVLDVLGAPNEMTIEPTFKVLLTGNNEEDKVTLADNYANKKVKVSAKANYNIQLIKNKKAVSKETVDYGEGNVTGRMYGYAVLVQLYNSDIAKGLKGIEYPKGDIKFDINFDLVRTSLQDTDEEDITDICTPILWNYKVNKSSAIGNIEGRNMIFGAGSQFHDEVPYGEKLNDRTRSIYKSGNISMIQNGRTISTTISNYEFDGIFPKYPYYTTLTTEPLFSDNVGCINASYFQVFVPDNEASTMSDKKYYLTVSDNDFEATALSEIISTEQQVTTDDSVMIQHYAHIPATFNQAVYLANDGATERLGKSFESGDSRAVLGQYIEVWNKFSMNLSAEENANSATKFIKFDGDCVEPALFSNEEKYIKKFFDGDMAFNVWYITKPDGTNWISQSEMNNANIEDMLYFSNIEDIPEGYVCVGEYFESISGSITPSSGDNNVIIIRLKVKENAKVGQTYGITVRTTTWLEEVDRNQYSITKENFDQWPGCTWTSGNVNYIKTEYDLDGNIIEGTHKPGWKYGQSLLALGSDLSVSKTAFDSEMTVEKENFDIGKNEFDVTYKLQPNLPANAANIEIENVDLKIVDVLPKGVKYIPGSANCEEPEINNNADGSTELVWYIYGKNVGDDLDPIIYKAHIDEETMNGTKYESTAVISEIIGEGEEAKVGNSLKEFRTTRNTINAINLASYASYETTTTPIIETNGDIHFKITVMNKTDRDANEFQLLDILPYNNDELGSKFSGNYTVSKIDLNGTNVSSSEIIDISDVKLYITNDASIRTNITAKDTDLGTTSIWEEKISGDNISKEIAGFALTGTLKSQERLEIDVYLKTNGNNPKDIYVNRATEQINMQAEEMQTSVVETRVVKRELNGKVWFDSNKNGIIDDGENYIEGAKLTLLNEDGSFAKDIDGDNIEPVTTNEDGYYCFENMAKGNYKVQIEQIDDKKEITLKNVGTNVEINNKFNSDLLTDVYTTLNGIESPVLSINNVNVGLTYKDAKVTVHYYLEGTTQEVSNDETIEGLVEDTYETGPLENISEKYELVSVPTNDSGTMTVEPTIVIYYYKLKDASVTVHHYINGTTTQVPSNIEGVRVEDEIKPGKVDEPYTTSASDNISNKYELVETQGNTSGNMTIAPITVTYYYDLKNASVRVKYLKKGTDEVLDTEETIEGKVDTEYRTTQKTISGYTCVEDTENTEGIMTVEPIDVIYYYLPNASAKVQYIDQLTGDVLEEHTENGVVGDIFETTAKDIENYVLVAEPEEKIVTMEEDENVLKYYYKHVSGGVIEKHIDIMTNEILYNEVHEGKEGDTYGKIEAKSFEGYDLVEDRLPTNAEGTMTIGQIEVKYYYIRKTSVVTKYIDMTTQEELADEIIQEGHEKDRYVTEQKEFNNYHLEHVPENASGTMKVTTKEKENGEFEINTVTSVIYYYVHNSAGVVERHYDILTNELLENEKTYNGFVGDEYKTSCKEFEGYDLVEDRLPTNAEGTMTIGQIEVNYYYIRKAEVEVKYIDKTTGKEIAPEEKIPGHVNDTYKTELKEIQYYKFSESTSNVEGKMKADVLKLDDGTERVNNKIEVKYYYVPLTFNLKVENVISKILVNNEAKTISNDSLSKIEIHRTKLASTKVKVECTIRVSNTGELDGSTVLIGRIPEGFIINEEDNKDWTIKDGIPQIEIDKIEAGKEKKYKLVLEWKQGEVNLGTKDIIANIINVKNDANFKEVTEDDNEDKVTAILTIATGEDKELTEITVLTILTAIITLFGIIVFGKISKKE